MESEKFFNPENQEKKYTSKIDLHFFRHSIKESDPKKTNREQLLTEEGRKLAKEKSSSETNLGQSVAFGSPRPRAQETAGFVMAGSRDEIIGNESLEELKAKIDKDLAVGSKIGIDARLDFNDESDTPYGKEFYGAADRGEYLKFLVEDSDELAEKLGDKKASTYSRMASEVSSIVEKYIAIAPRWDKLAADESKQYKDTLERYLGTHQGVSESFLAKVIELTKGVEARDSFVQSVDKMGFDFVEGFDIEIRNTKDGEPQVYVSFKKEKEGKVIFKFSEEVPIEIIRGITAG